MVPIRRYSVVLENSAQAGAIDFFEITAAAGKPIALLGLDIGQATELGDAAEEQIRWFIKRASGSYTSGSGGSTPTPAPINPNDASVGFSVESLNTTQLVVGSGALTTLHASTFNVRVGLQMFWTPETAPIAGGSQALVVGLAAAPADSVTWTGTAYVAELA